MTSSNWEIQRTEIAERVVALRTKGVCPTCHDLEAGDLFGSNGRLLFEDERFLVVLERFPRMWGHSVIVYKPHRDDISELGDDEAGSVMLMVLRIVRALKEGLSAEKVYVNTMCDGTPNHLHFQLFPRFAGDEIGSRRFVLPRAPIEGAEQAAAAVRRALAVP